MKQLMDGASRIEAVLCGGKAQQDNCGECNDCRGHGRAQNVCDAAAGGGADGANGGALSTGGSVGTSGACTGPLGSLLGITGGSAGGAGGGGVSPNLAPVCCGLSGI